MAACADSSPYEYTVDVASEADRLYDHYEGPIAEKLAERRHRGAVPKRRTPSFSWLAQEPRVLDPMSQVGQW